MQKIGITERDDAGLDLSWADILKTNDYAGAVLITKNANPAFQNNVWELWNQSFKNIIIHFTCTGWGNTEMEPFVPTPESQFFCFQVHNYNQSLFSIVENFITCDVESEELDALLDENDLFRYRSAQDASDAGYYVDYYDNIGQRFEYYYHDVDSILDRIVSMRIVETNTNKKKG